MFYPGLHVPDTPVEMVFVFKHEKRTSVYRGTEHTFLLGSYDGCKKADIWEGIPLSVSSNQKFIDYTIACSSFGKPFTG